MRLRLRIERNEIPTTNVLWTIDDTTERRQTVAQLLTKVNERIPLEGDTWGLEDYAVSVGGYEALHYQEVGTTFQHEDEVCIKPLQYVEAKSRLLSGRDQITPDGRHLHDGVAFGRPLVKRAIRPEVYIPPRKKPRLDDEEAGALTGMQEDGDEDSDADDEDFDGEYGNEDVDENSEEEEDATPAQPRISAAVREVDDAEDGSSSSSTSSSDSESETDSDSESDDSASDSDSSSDEETWEGIDGEAPAAGPAKPTNAQPPVVNGHKQVKGASASTDKGIPHEGETATKARNQRRREQRQLKVLKDAGLLPSDATFSTLHNWQKDKNATSGTAARAIITEQRNIEGKRQKLLDQIASGGVDVNGASKHETAASVVKEVATEDTARSTSKPAKEPIMREEDQDEAPEVEPATAQQRKRLNLASMNRLVFGSLGVRNPKTQGDKDALQKRLAGGTKRKATTALQPAQPEEEDDQDAWRNKIELSAIECCDQGVELSVPPFPFQQRWDPQYQHPKKTRNKRRKVEANGTGHAQFTETYDKYNQNGEGDALDYDDHSEDDQEDSYWEEGALLENDDDDEGFPPLADDVGTLPSVVEADLSVGDFLVFTELACSAATGWQPKTITGTVRLDVKDDQGWTGKLAPRDRAPKKFDDEGKRVYSKFEMEGASDDGADEDSKSFTLEGVKALKLLAKATPVAKLFPAAEG